MKNILTPTGWKQINEDTNPLKSLARTLSGRGSGMIPRSAKTKRIVGAKYLDKTKHDQEMASRKRKEEFENLKSAPLRTREERKEHLAKLKAIISKNYKDINNEHNRSMRAISLKYQKESITTPKKTGTPEEIKHFVIQTIHDVMPDLEDSLKGDKTTSLYATVIDHLNDRVYDKFSDVSDRIRRSIVKKAVDQYIHDDRHEVRAYVRKAKRAAYSLTRPPKVKLPKENEPWNDVGFKTKTKRPPIAGTTSYGKAKYSVKEEADMNNKAINKIVSLIESRTHLPLDHPHVMDHINNLSQNMHDDTTFNAHLANLKDDPLISKEHLRHIDAKLEKRHEGYSSYAKYTPKTATRDQLVQSLSDARVRFSRTLKMNQPAAMDHRK